MIERTAEHGTGIGNVGVATTFILIQSSQRRPSHLALPVLILRSFSAPPIAPLAGLPFFPPTAPSQVAVSASRPLIHPSTRPTCLIMSALDQSLDGNSLQPPRPLSLLFLEIMSSKPRSRGIRKRGRGLKTRRAAIAAKQTAAATTKAQAPAATVKPVVANVDPASLFDQGSKIIVSNLV